MKMVKAHAVDLPNIIATTVINVIDSNENSNCGMPGKSPSDERIVIAAVHYKPTIDRNTQMEHHLAEKSDIKTLKLN